jgi:hypothetical protein
MAFSVSKSRPFRSLGLYKSSGKHAAPRGSAPATRSVAEAPVPEGAEVSDPGSVRRPSHHAATSPRLTSPDAPEKRPASKADTAEKTAA